MILSMGALKALIKRYLLALASSLYLLTFGFFRRKHAGLIADLVGLIRKPPRQCPAARTEDFAQWVPAPVSIKILSPRAENGNVSELELLYLSQLIKQRGPRKLFEFGTFNGRTALNMAANAPANSRVYTLDLPEARIENTAHPIDPSEKVFVSEALKKHRKYAGTNYEDRIFQLFGDSGAFDFEPYNHQFDFVFIDASHTYENVLNDSRTAVRLLSSDKEGLLVWHDYNGWEGVTRAVDEFARQQKSLPRLCHIRGTSLALLTLDPSGTPG